MRLVSLVLGIISFMLVVIGGSAELNLAVIIKLGFKWSESSNRGR